MDRKKTSVIVIAVAVAIAAIAGAVFLLQPSQKGIAATTDAGIEVTEQQVLDRIYESRVKAGTVNDDSKFVTQATLNGNSSMKEFRENMIRTIIKEELTKRAFEDRDITVTDEEVDAEYERQAKNWELSGASVSYEDGYKASGYTEESIKEALKKDMLADKLGASVATDEDKARVEELTSQSPLATANKVVPAGSLKNWCEAFPLSNSEQADEALALAKDDWAAALSKYGDGKSLPGMAVYGAVDDASSIDGMKVGSIEKIESGSGTFIVSCIEKIESPEGGWTELSQVPEKLKNQASSATLGANSSLGQYKEAYNRFISSLTNDISIEITDMPNIKPYTLM